VGELSSGIYVGHVAHHRRAPRSHGFRLPLYMLYLDLHELPALDRVSPLFSIERPNLLSFRRRDYLGDPAQDLSEAVRDRVQDALGHRPTGPVRLLTHVRAFGHVFNPVSFYYCFEDGAPRAVVAEITNTPWGERHCYVLAADPQAGFRDRFDKRFHVSPFMDMQQRYDWRLGVPGRRLHVHMQNHEGGERIFDASLVMKRRPFERRNLHRLMLRHPAMAAGVHAAIYGHALSLWLKGVPLHPHPRKRAALAASSRSS
jgi:DUF1365 family protein